MSKNVSVFVIMPSGNRDEYTNGKRESDHVFETIIKPAVIKAASELGPDLTFDVTREVDKNESGSITAGIVKGLVEADVVIADLTGQNANVFFELGIRSSLRHKVTILLAQANTRLPFDIKDYRYLTYDPFVTSTAAMKLAEFIVKGLQPQAPSDSLVFDTYPSLTVRIPGTLEALGDAAAQTSEMSWDEYFGTIEWLGALLRDAFNDGSFPPDCVAGISNGGLVVADLLSRNYLRGTPVVSLWARRFEKSTDHPSWYFKNDLNDGMLAAVANGVAIKRPKDPVRVLLVDDRCGTGQTAVQAINYLKEGLGTDAQIVFLPLVISRPEYIDTIKQYLPCHFVDHNGRRPFSVPEADFLKKLVTASKQFPYKKAIAD